MKLTPKQNEVIEQYKYLESKYGKGNVFLRCNDGEIYV